MTDTARSQTYENERVVLGCLARYVNCFESKMEKLSADLFADELLHVLDCLKGEPLKWRCYIELMADTGMRRGEICGLVRQDVDLEANEISIRHSLVEINTENGTNNMKVSLAACNGSIIDPGEIWSFNDCTGDSNLASNGYLPANVIVDGKIEQGNGGGICQSSSTIYNAAIRANLDIVERAPHEWASLYVPTGLDATIDYPNLDLKLENPSKYQVFLECKLVNYTLYVSFWGVQDSSYDEIRTRNELGETSGSKYSVKAWRVYFKDGKKIKEEELPSSYYDLKNGQVFYPADNDAGAVETNVDNLNDSVSINTQTYDSGQSGGTDTQITYTEPATEAAVQTDAQAQTEAQSSTSQAADSA